LVVIHVADHADPRRLVDAFHHHAKGRPDLFGFGRAGVKKF
jgi:hypothetical protein